MKDLNESAEEMIPNEVEESRLTISVIGCGYLGAIHAACMASLGHRVIGIDADADKVNRLTAGSVTFFEPQFPELLAAAMASDRLRFSSEIADASQATVHFICVGTPQKRGENSADLSQVNAAIRRLSPHLKPGDIVVGKSTVPVGTAECLANEIRRVQPEAILAWNPEFLREGHAVSDTFKPDRLVYGVPDDSDGRRATQVLDRVYARVRAGALPL